MNTFDRELCGRQHDAEARLSMYLRHQRGFNGKFQRRHRIDPYIVDFFCASANLVIEFDDGMHPEVTAYDVVRTAYLEWRGYRVLRFRGDDVMARTAEVLAAIAQALGESTPQGPTASPAVPPHSVRARPADGAQAQRAGVA